MNNPTEPQSKTPETDNFRLIGLHDSWASRYKEMVEHCEKLERDRNALRVQVATLTRERDEAKGALPTSFIMNNPAETQTIPNK